MQHCVTKVYMIILMQKDLQQGVDFYVQLGLKVIFFIPEKWCELEIDGIKIGLCPSQAPIEAHHSGLVFQVQDLRTLHKTLTEAGIVFLNEPSQATHGLMVSCADPSGNVFDFYQPTHENLKNSLKKESHGCKDGADKNPSKQCCQA